MKDSLILIAHLLTTIAKLMGPGGARAIVAHSLPTKQQLLIINRSRHRSPKLTALDRFLMGFCSLFLLRRHTQRAAVIIRPSTLMKFHQLFKQREYRLLYSSSGNRKSGPKSPSKELIAAIVVMKRRNPNPTFGCPRITQHINFAFGIAIDKDVVRRVLAAHYLCDSGGDGPSWLTFLGHTKDSLWSVDMFRCESILLKSHWVLVVMDQCTRRLVGFGVQPGEVDGVSLCRLFNMVISTKGIPRRLSSDNDPLFRYHQWQANLRILDIEEIKGVPYTPTSHPFVERLIGNRVVVRFSVNTLISCFSGISRTWSENSRNSLNTTIKIEYISHLMRKLLNLSTVKCNLDARCSITIHGVHTARGFFRLRSPREL